MIPSFYLAAYLWLSVELLVPRFDLWADFNLVGKGSDVTMRRNGGTYLHISMVSSGPSQV
jgi:hypothetical protein